MEKVSEFQKEYRNKTSGPKYLFLGPRIDWGVLKFLPGEQLGYHYHNEVEETFYFTKGNPKMIVDDKEFKVSSGEAIRLEPKEKHNIVNDTDQPIEAVFIKVPHNPQDKVRIT